MSFGARLLRLEDAVAHGVEFGELGVDPAEHCFEPPSLGFAGCAAGVVCGEGIDDVGEGEADRLEFAREPDALDGVGRVVAVAGWPSLGWWEHADALVEADRVDGHPGVFGNFTDSHALALDSGPYSTVYRDAMTNVLHLQAQSTAPIACDLSTADDTPDERLREYGRLFERGLLRRERRAGAVVFSFGADPGTREALEDLARRESACCPFLDYRIETVGDEVIWTTTNTIVGEGRVSGDVFLDAFHDLPDHAGSDLAGLFGRLAERDVHVIEAGSERFELRG
jgi:hypothetical protein